MVNEVYGLELEMFSERIACPFRYTMSEPGMKATPPGNVNVAFTPSLVPTAFALIFDVGKTNALPMLSLHVVGQKSFHGNLVLDIRGPGGIDPAPLI